MSDVRKHLQKLLKEAIANGWSVKAIAEESGVARAVVTRIMADGESGGIQLSNVDLPLDWFGVTLTQGKVPKRKK